MPHVRSIRSVLLSLIFCLPAMAQTQPADAPQPVAPQNAPAADQTGPDALEIMRNEFRRQILSELRDLPDLGTLSPQQIVQFSLRERDLEAHTPLAATEKTAKVQIRGLPGHATVTVTVLPNVPTPFLQLIHRNTEHSGAVMVMTSVFAGPTHVQVVRDIQRPDMDISVQLVQNLVARGTEDDDKVVSMYITSIDSQSGLSLLDLRANAPSFSDLQKMHPNAISEYLRPIFRDLGQDTALFGLADAIAWQVLSPLATVDPQIEQQVAQLVRQLDAEEARERESAGEALQQLGLPGVLALLRMDRSTLSPEQHARIDAIVAPYQTLDAEQAKALRLDRRFLLDTMENEDPALRRLALKQLQETTGQAIQFDVDAPREQRKQALQQLRRQLLAVQSDQ